MAWTVNPNPAQDILDLQSPYPPKILQSSFEKMGRQGGVVFSNISCCKQSSRISLVTVNQVGNNGALEFSTLYSDQAQQLITVNLSDA